MGTYYTIPSSRHAHTASDHVLDPFDAPSSFPFPSPTAPASGPSLLDDSESKYLESFFEGVSSDHFNYDFFTNPPDGSDLALGWDELPPTFMGTTSSFGQQPQIGSHLLGDMNFNEMGPHINGASAVPSSAPAGILAAAPHLPNGSNGPSQGIANGTYYHGADMSIRPTNGQAGPQSMSQYVSPRTNHAVQGKSGSRDDISRAPFYTDMVFGGRSEESTRRRQVSLAHVKDDVCWGSDSNFGSSQAFIPPAYERKQVAALELAHITAVEEAFLETKKGGSPEDSQSSSPVHSHANIGQQRTKSISQGNDEGQDSRPIKRRKSNFQDEDGDDDSPISAKQGNRKQKPLKKEGSLSPSSKSNQKRRKSATAATAATKTARENLTEEQKRENHIKSEQKRRTLIREGFEDLNQLVPGLRGGGFSKSAVLIMSADWLESLLQGNEVLRQRLATMQNR
jgi:hypothetical protein